MANLANRSAVALSTIGERMAQVVDPAARQRMTGEYLALLHEYQSGRVRPDFNRRVELLLSRTGFGQLHYKLTPALGTVNDKFFRSYTDAAESLTRLEALAARQPNAEVRTKWEWFLKDIGQRLVNLHNEAEIATGNVNLSRMDALANQVNNILAARLMPAEVEWRRALGQAPVTFLPRGNSAAVAESAQAGMPNRAFQAPPVTEAQGQYPYARTRMRGQPGQGEVTRYYAREGRRTGLAGILDTFTELVTGTWDSAKGTAAATTGETEALFNDTVRRLAALKSRLSAQDTDIKRLQGAASPDADKLSADLAYRQRGYNSAKAEIDGIAAQLKMYSYDVLDSASELVRSLLGQDEMAVSTVPASWLVLRPQIDTAAGDVVTLEKDSVNAEAAISSALRAAGLTGMPRAAAVAAGGGLLALAAGAAALLVLSRKRG